MKFADILLLIILAVCVAGAIIVIRKKKGCCSNCSECSKAGTCQIKDKK